MVQTMSYINVQKSKSVLVLRFRVSTYPTQK